MKGTYMRSTISFTEAVDYNHEFIYTYVNEIILLLLQDSVLCEHKTSSFICIISDFSHSI